MKTLLRVGVIVAVVLTASSAVTLAAEPASAGVFGPVSGPTCAGDAAPAGPWGVNWSGSSSTEAPATLTFSLESTAASVAATLADEGQTSGRRRVVAFEYSDGYKKRAKIHKIASVATLPLFVTEYWLGAYMYAYPDKITSGLQNAHTAVGVSLGVLFGVNTVTGVWNLWEGRKDPNHRGRRMFHGITMLIADAGFALAGAMRPERPIENVNDYYSQRQTHRTIAVTSMAIATVSYLTMLFGSH